jgi:hypothetical protein
MAALDRAVFLLLHRLIRAGLNAGRLLAMQAVQRKLGLIGSDI